MSFEGMQEAHTTKTNPDYPSRKIACLPTDASLSGLSQPKPALRQGKTSESLRLASSHGLAQSLLGKHDYLNLQKENASRRITYHVQPVSFK